MKRITVKVSTSSIDKAISQLNGYREEIDKRVKKLIDMMVAHGEDYAINRIGYVDTGGSLASISGYRNGNRGVIVAGGNAIWLEFGTGVYYNGSVGSFPNPLGPSTPGVVGIGQYGEGHGAQPYGWWYNDGGEWKHTMGIPAQMFMYGTIQELKRRFPEMARKVFEA